MSTDWTSPDYSAPILEAKGFAVPTNPLDPESKCDVHMTMSVDHKSLRRALRVLEMVREAITQWPRPTAIRRLARLVHDFGSAVTRSPDLWDFLEYLLRKRHHEPIRRILGKTRRGRPFGTHYCLMGLVERLVDQQGWSVRKASVFVAREYGGQFCITARAIENRYSADRELYELASGSRFAPGEALLPYREARAREARITGER